MLGHDDGQVHELDNESSVSHQYDTYVIHGASFALSKTRLILVACQLSKGIRTVVALVRQLR